MPEAQQQLKAILCHSSPDKPVIRDPYQKLVVDSWTDLWLDEEKLMQGQD